MRLNSNITKIVVLLIVCAFSTLSIAQDRLIGARYPALSPDGQNIAFSYIGDLWMVSSQGGKAQKLTNHSGYEKMPVWSPDGKWIAFTSNRYGNDDIFLMPAEGGTPKRLTYHSGTDIVSDFTPDSKTIIFRSGRQSSTGIYKVSVNGGNAVPVIDTYWSYPYAAKVKPDGKKFVFALGGEHGSWWRRGYKGANSSKVWIKSFDSNTAENVVSDLSNCFWPAYNSDGTKIYFVTDKQYNAKNIWSVNPDGTDMKAVTKNRDKDILWMSIADGSDKAVYERDFGIWTTDLSSGRSKAVNIDLPIETKSNSTFFLKNERVSEYDLSPDGKKIAAVVRGEIFILSVEGGYARNITNTPWREQSVVWDKDNQHVIFISDINADPEIYRVSALGDAAPVKLTNSASDKLSPIISPDGKFVAYYSGPRQIRIMSPEGKDDKLLVEGDFGGRFADGFSWSPDSKYLAIVEGGTDSDIYAVNIETGEKTLMTNTAYDESNPVWSSDGKFMLFSSNRYGHNFPEFTGKVDIYRLDFQPETPEFDENKFEELFKEKKKDDKKDDKKSDKKDEDKLEVKLNLENLDRQTRQITNTLGNDYRFIINPKDKEQIYFVTNIDGRGHFWQKSMKPSERRFTPFLPNLANPSNLQTSSDGKFIYYQASGKIGRINLNSKKSQPVSFSTTIEVDKTADYEQMLGETYYTLQHYFYDGDHHNINWKNLYESYRPVLQQVRENRDFNDYANLMIGHLNSSHTGFRWPNEASTEKPSAHTGAHYDFSTSNIVVNKIIINGPLYQHRDSVAVGDILKSVNGKPAYASENIWEKLNGQMSKRLNLTFVNPGSGKETEVSIKPISGRAENRLLLDEWVQSRKKIVEEKSDGKAAYIYMRAMGGGDLSKFMLELERDAVPKKALILDVRWNNGGNVHDKVLEALMKPVYAKWRIRGLSETQQSTYGFSDKPVILVTNERTLSDGEMTASGFRALNRGPILGNTTYGWLIFTTSARLMNGGSFRLPFWGCYSLDGENLERNGGIKPDILVINDLNHDLKGLDPQLDKAIEEILKKIK